MSLSDISRKEARSDVQSRIGIKPEDEIISEEINRWLNMEQFNFFNRMGVLVNKWYGKRETVAAIAASAGAITRIDLTGSYAATKIAQITKFVLADATTVWKPVEFANLEPMLANTTYDKGYYYAFFGEHLYLFVGTSATALSTDSSILYFIRKPDEMAGDINVHTITLATVIQDEYVDIDGIRLTARDAATGAGVADFISTGSDTEAAAALVVAINALFQPVTGVSATSDAAIVTLTGATTVVPSGSTMTVATSTASMVDVPTEFVDLIIMGAQAKAMGKLKMINEQRVIEDELAQRYNEITQAYGQEIQLAQIEKAAGVQTPQRKE